MKVNNQTGHKQSDLEDFLAKESNDLVDEELKTKKTYSNKETKDDNFFIPEEEVAPKKRVGDKVDPFKEADLLNGNLNDYNNYEDETDNSK